MSSFFLRAAVIEPGISAYLPQAWKGVFAVSFVWFLHRWKTNFIGHAMAKQTATGIDRERLSAFDKMSSLGLIALGVIALAEACGVPVQSILTVGGVGGNVLTYSVLLCVRISCTCGTEGIIFSSVCCLQVLLLLLRQEISLVTC